MRCYTVHLTIYILVPPLTTGRCCRTTSGWRRKTSCCGNCYVSKQRRQLNGSCAHGEHRGKQGTPSHRPALLLQQMQ